MHVQFTQMETVMRTVQLCLMNVLISGGLSQHRGSVHSVYHTVIR